MRIFAAAPGQVQRSASPAPAKQAGVAPPAVDTALRAPGRPLDAATRAFMEPRFGHDFSRVRVHTGRQAAESAGAVGARAYTVGGDIVFGAGEYAPSSGEGRRLLAHELTHVVQQAAGAAPVLRRVPTISIADATARGPLAPNQRRAAVSNPITCCSHILGTLHAMPQFAVSGGVGQVLHFIAGGAAPPAGDRCHCDDHRMIQVVTTSHPPAGRNGAGFVDNNGRNTPFHGGPGGGGFLVRRGEHAVPNPPSVSTPFPDVGERVATTESIYDQPSRATTGRNTSISWRGEACVACVKNAEPDRILGCVTYGFSRPFNAASNSFGPVAPVAPAALARPSSHFLGTLRTDPTTSSYDFQGPPGLVECTALPEQPLPDRGDTRVA